MIAGMPRAGPPSAELRLRAAAPTDRVRVLVWNGDRAVRARSLDPRPIDLASHARWFAVRLADPLTRMWIIEIERQPLGLVRIQRAVADGPGRISIVVDPIARHRGLGRRAIRSACQLDGGPIVAEILADNHVSVACFERAGFEDAGGTLDAPLGTPAAGVRRFVWRYSHA